MNYSINIVRLRSILFLFLLMAGLIAAMFSVSSYALASQPPGDPLPAISCLGGYSAEIYAENITNADGLAIAPDDTIYAAQELTGTLGSVVAIDTFGNATTVMTGLNSPEGVALDAAGNLYVVEDAANGRLLQRTTAGAVNTLASGLDAPEGVHVSSSGDVFITESNAELTLNNPLAAAARVSSVSGGTATPLVTQGLIISGLNVEFVSYAGITQGADGYLYATNETSGVNETQTVGFLTYTITSTKSIMRIDPTSGAETVFAENLRNPEGLRFSAGGNFPLYVVEEFDGRIAQIQADGTHSTLCSGFDFIEDVVVNSAGELIVSDDSNHRLIRIKQAVSPPTLTPRLYLPILTR